LTRFEATIVHSETLEPWRRLLQDKTADRRAARASRQSRALPPCDDRAALKPRRRPRLGALHHGACF